MLKTAILLKIWLQNTMGYMGKYLTESIEIIRIIIYRGYRKLSLKIKLCN